MTPYVAPRYDVIDARGKVACRVHRPEEDDPKVTVISNGDPEPEEIGVYIGTDEIPALIDALRRIYRDCKRDLPQYERDMAAMDAARRNPNV